MTQKPNSELVKSGSLTIEVFEEGSGGAHVRRLCF
jgi:hypothetical protein